MKKRNFIFLLPALTFLSCSEDSVDQLKETEQLQSKTLELPSNVEAAYPETIGEVSQVYYAGSKISVEEVKGNYIYEGDIIFDRNMVTSQPEKLVFEVGEIPTEKSVGRTSRLWPNNVVYYAIDGNLTDKNRVYDAIAHWESNTPLEFVERSSESNYIYFTPGSGCSSYVGMTGSKQNITLSSSCTTGNTIHEIGHAVGLWHEQSRVDRDNHIKINYNNIQSGREHNFETYADRGMDGDEFTSTLDFGSIMMYGSYSFSSNGQPTITKTNGSTYQVQRNALSSGDITGIKSMYPDNGGSTTTTTEPTYINGEYYTISGLTVLRYNDSWYFWSKYGWRKVKLVNERWYWA